MSCWGIADDGARVRVDLGAGADPADLAELWPPLGLRRVDPARPGAPVEAAEPELVVRYAGADDVLRVESDLSLFAAEHLAGPVPVHAAVVVVAGSAIVLPGRSHAGKTTLALALGELGGQIASDEYALIDPGSGAVTGWPRPLHVRTAAGVVERRALRSLPDEAPVPVGVVASLRFEPGLAAVRAEVVAPADAAVSLLDNTVCAQRRPADALAAAAAVARGAVCVAGTRGEAGSAARWLLDLVAEAELRG